MKRRICSLLVCLCLCLSLLPVSAGAASDTTTVRIEVEVYHQEAFDALAFLNEWRREAGVPELVMDETLMEAAIRRAAELAFLFQPAHIRPNGEADTTVFEDGQNPMGLNPRENAQENTGGHMIWGEDSIENFKTSAMHHDNQMGQYHQSVGIGCVRDADGNTYWIQIFGNLPAFSEATLTTAREMRVYDIELVDWLYDFHLTESDLDLAVNENAVVYLYNEEARILPDVMRSSNENVVALREEEAGGVGLYAVGAGTASVTLGAGDLSETIQVTVSPISTTGLEIIAPSGERYLQVGESMELQAVTKPQGAPAYTGALNWTSYDPTVLSVIPHGDRATVTALAPGYAMVGVSTAEQVDWAFSSVQTRVDVYAQGSKPASSAVMLPIYALDLAPGQQVTLPAYVRPSLANQSVVWSSDNPWVASVDQNGKVTANAKGFATLNIAAADGKSSIICNVMVRDTPDGGPWTFTDVDQSDYLYEPVVWATALGLEHSDYLGSPTLDHITTRMELVRYLWELNAKPSPGNLTFSSFTDVDPFRQVTGTDPDKEDRLAAEWALESGVTAGTGNGSTFSPDDTVTRAQAVTFLYRAAGSPTVTGSVGFTDVDPNGWFADAAAWAVSAGIASGTGSNTFSPDRPCTRGEILTFLYRLYG